jgi:hypothetical protein
LRGHVREESEPGVYRWRERADDGKAMIELAALERPSSGAEPKALPLHWLMVLRTTD